MDGFLRSCRAAVKTGSQGSSVFHVVLGNESCDLDSVVSSLAFAYFLSKTSGSQQNSVTVPVLNIPHSEFSLRSESIFLLKEGGVPTECLVFRDQVDLAHLHSNKRLALTLVDHNVLPSTDSGLEGAVVEVIDHHQLERNSISPSCPVTVETVASCATLVTERIINRAPEVLDRQLALLLYGTILLDSVNLSPEAGKVTTKDSKMVRLLETQFSDLPPRGALFQAMQNAKIDLSGLSTEQILLKDMKTVAGGDLRIAVSTVYMTLNVFLQRKGLQQELCEFCHMRQLGALVAMTISFSQSNEPVREVAVYSSSSLYREEVNRVLLDIRNPSLSLSPFSSPYNDVLAYHQGNGLASRKKILPVLKDFLSKWERRQVHCGDVGEELEDQFDQSDDLRPPLYSAPCHHQRRLLGGEDCGTEEDCGLGDPPTPMNSLVEGCPLDRGFSQEALMEKFRKMGGGEEEREGEGMEGRRGGRWT